MLTPCREPGREAPMFVIMLAALVGGPLTTILLWQHGPLSRPGGDARGRKSRGAGGRGAEGRAEPVERGPGARGAGPGLRLVSRAHGQALRRDPGRPAGLVPYPARSIGRGRFRLEPALPPALPVSDGRKPPRGPRRRGRRSRLRGACGSGRRASAGGSSVEGRPVRRRRGQRSRNSSCAPRSFAERHGFNRCRCGRRNLIQNFAAKPDPG